MQGSRLEPELCKDLHFDNPNLAPCLCYRRSIRIFLCLIAFSKMSRLCFAAVLVCGAVGSPTGLRIDLALTTSELPTPFISLDNGTGTSPNASLIWQLPVGETQTSYLLSINASNGSVVWTSGIVESSAQLAYFSRDILTPESQYTWTVSARGGGGDWNVSAPARFITGASSDTWASTAPIWASPCGWNGSNAPPAFARFAATPYIPLAAAGAELDLALFFATGAPPTYNDHITKLLGGYALFLGGMRVGVGPGRNACGPFALGTCE